MGSNKHKHKSKKRKHYRSSDSSEQEYQEKERHRHHKKHHREKREKHSKPILIEEDDSSNSDDDVIIVDAPPPPKISKTTAPSSPPRKITRHASPPPPPVISRRKSPTPPPAPSVSRGSKPSNSSGEVSLSIEETNKLRVKIGLKPLEVGASEKVSHNEKKDTFGGVDMGEFVHRPPENIASKTASEKFKERIAVKRDKRVLEDKLAKVKKLAEADESDDDDVSKWVAKNRKIVSEKEQAEKRAKELDAMDEVFGIGDLIEEDKRATRGKAYTSRDLKGLKVEHESDAFVEGRDVILTLKDRAVLDEADDTLVNVNIVDDERYKKNIDRRKQRPNYRAYDDEDEFEESILEKKVLSKYDEEIKGEKKSSFVLGADFKAAEEARRELIRNKLQQHHIGKKLETLSMALTPASEYYTEQEIHAKFKKPTKKVRKIRKKRILRADDLLRDDYADLATKSESMDKDSLKNIGTRRPSRNASRIKDEPMDVLDTDDLPLPAIDTSKIKLEDDEDDRDLQLALHRTRKLQQTETLMSSMVKPPSDDEMEDSTAAPAAGGGSIVLNATAEFCRTLGDIPTYGQAGNREEDPQELLDFEREMKKEKLRKEDLHSLTSGWNEVELDSTPVDIVTSEVPILDIEPDISSGVAGALKLALSKGYIQTESEKRPSASRFAHLQAQNYSIEDKAHAFEDDKHARRERYCGPTSDFKEKEGYKPNVKLEYIDDDGHILSAKEAFRYLSHKFHGKGPGKNKIEKRMKKGEQETLMKQMSSTDTPLGTLNMLQQKQKETQSPFVVLSGSKHGHSTAIAKLKL